MSNFDLTVFSYKLNQSGQFFPIVPLTIYTSTGKRDFSALIDSGATVSIFKPDVAKKLGIKIENEKEIFLGGLGGRIKGYLHEVKIEVAGKIMTIPIVFSHEYMVSFNLLGRETFFENFLITFDEKNKNWTKVDFSFLTSMLE